MKELHIDRFDALISLASAECVKEEADAFLAADISGIEDNPRMLRKILGASRHQKHKPLKIFLLVALLCMSIAFTACMLVPEIRHAIWNVLVRDHDDHVEIEFESGAVTETVTEELGMYYPRTVDDIMTVTYMPEGYVKEKAMNLFTQYFEVYYSVEERCGYTIVQSVIISSDSFVDDIAGDITHIEVGETKAVLVHYHESDFMYSLIWQDNQYRYTLYGNFPSVEELIRIAESVV